MSLAPRALRLIIGVDLSRTNLGLCALPLGWLTDKGPDWSCLRFDTLTLNGQSPLYGDYADLNAGREEHYMAGVDYIVKTAVDWIEPIVESPGVDGFWEAWIEGGITHGHHVIEQAEVRGAFRLELSRRLQRPGQIAEQSAARKLLLGRLPPSDRKSAVVSVLGQMGAPFQDDHQCDAFVAANFAWHVRNRLFIGLTDPGPSPRKPRLVAAPA